MDNFFFEIFIPSFRQQDKLAACLENLKNQAFKSFKVTIVDDASGDNYDSILNADWPFEIKLVTNQTNRGAVNNMLHCMEMESLSPYVMVFHEDDLMHPEYLETAYSYLSDDNNISLFVSTMSFYNKKSNHSFEQSGDVKVNIIEDEKSLIIQFLLGKSISLSSCIFLKSILNPFIFDLEKFSMLGDRPFMGKFLEGGRKIAFADVPFIMADDHSDEDNRWKALRVKHLQNLFSYYKSFFANSLRAEREFLDVHLTRLAMENYTLLEKQYRPARFTYVLNNIVRGNISLKYYLLLFPNFRRSVEIIKGIFK